MNNFDAMEIVGSSNLPEEAMRYVLCALISCDTKKCQNNIKFREKLLDTMPIGEPMRIKEIRATNFPFHSIQKFTRQMRYLKEVGLVKREEVKTGNIIKVTSLKLLPPTADNWGHRLVTVEKEVEERIAVYTRVA